MSGQSVVTYLRKSRVMDSGAFQYGVVEPTPSLSDSSTGRRAPIQSARVRRSKIEARKEGRRSKPSKKESKARQAGRQAGRAGNVVVNRVLCLLERWNEMIEIAACCMMRRHRFPEARPPVNFNAYRFAQPQIPSAVMVACRRKPASRFIGLVFALFVNPPPVSRGNGFGHVGRWFWRFSSIGDAGPPHGDTYASHSNAAT
jgi:hypothetical protein